MKRLYIFFVVILLLTSSGCYSQYFLTDNKPPASTEQNEFAEEPLKEPLEQGTVYDYCYSLLNTEQKAIYNKILAAAVNMSDGMVYLTDKEDEFSQNVNIAFSGVTTDHPELFWVSSDYTTYSKNEEKFYIKLKYYMDKTSKAAFVAALENRVEGILAETEGMSYFEKEQYFHDYLCNNVTYTADGVYSRYSVIGALVNGKAVCEGYSRAMQLLCKAAGINCSLVKGWSDDTSHMWNIVEISGEWYELDVTWDDIGEEGPRYKYFNLTTEEMLKDREIYAVLTEENKDINLKGGKYNLKLPQCTATTFSKEKLK